MADPDPRREARDVPAPGESAWPSPPLYYAGVPIEPQVRVRPPDRVWRHVLLLVATFVTMTYAGAEHYASFVSVFGSRALPSIPTVLFGGLWYSVAALAILGSHEMGHYVACRYYRIDSSMPYFLPMPLPLFGTLGAFIRIREPFRSKRELFDIGVAGPLAGFAVLVPVLFAGLLLSNVVRVPTELKGGVLLGEPLLFKAATWLVWGPIADGYTVNLHPMAFAAWFGMLATALNLFPIGQLDGGHISYAVLGRRSHIVTLATVGCAMVLTYFSSSWFLWTSLVVVMLFVFGSRHPRTADEASPLTRGRLALAFLALIVLALCFTPAPLEIIDLLPR